MQSFNDYLFFILHMRQERINHVINALNSKKLI